MFKVDIAGSCRQHPYKGHDRLVINQEKHVVGVFDGAGTAWASDIAARKLDSMAARSDFTVEQALGAIQFGLLFGGMPRRLQGKRPRMTTGVVMHFLQQGDQLLAEWGGAGDSFIVGLDHESEAFFEVHRGKDRDTSAFLGKPGAKRNMRFGATALRSSMTYLVGSDGLLTQAGSFPAAIPAIMADTNLSAQQAVENILDAAPDHDDKTAAIISFTRDF